VRFPVFVGPTCGYRAAAHQSQQHGLSRSINTLEQFFLWSRQVDLRSIASGETNLPGIIDAWYPGEEGGTAIAELLAGDYSPSGRLPVTFYESLEQLPPFDDYSMANRAYHYFRGEPLYPFGYGLSYTTFTYKDPHLSATSVGAEGTISVSVDVSNTGTMPGDEIAQVYLTHTEVVGAALRALQGFQRVHIAPGQTKTVTFELANRQLTIVDGAGTRRIVPETVKVWAGGGQPVSRAGLPKTAGV
jgi:beta-glucosidase